MAVNISFWLRNFRETSLMQNRIRSIERLISATSGLGLGTGAVEKQVARIKDRLKAGNDEEGRAFAPLKDPTAKGIPLSGLPKLFDSMKYDTRRSSAGFEQVAELRGQAATIVVHQDRLRPFTGWGTDDRDVAAEDLSAEISSAMKERT